MLSKTFSVSTFSVPTFGGPPDIVIGLTVPAELIAYYAAAPDNHNVIQGILYRQTATTYVYDIEIQHKVTGVISRAVGIAVAAVVAEHNRITAQGVKAIQEIGLHSAADVRFKLTSGLFLDDTTLLQIAAGASEVVNGALIVQAGGAFGVEGVFTIDAITAPRGLKSTANTTDNGTVVTTPAGGAETAVASANWDTEPTLALRNNGLWRGFLTGYYIESTGAGGIIVQTRVRKGAATVAGTQLTLGQYPAPAGFGGLALSLNHTFYLKNSSGGTVNTKLSATVAGVGGAGTCSLYGDANHPLQIDLEDMGDITDHIDIAAKAVSV
jgi:hypothetical protein